MIPAREAAAIVGKSPRTLRRLYNKGELPGNELGRGLMVPRAWIEEFCAYPAREAS